MSPISSLKKEIEVVEDFDIKVYDECIIYDLLMIYREIYVTKHSSTKQVEYQKSYDSENELSKNKFKI